MYNLAIVGGGLVGSVLALALHKCGLERILLLDAQEPVHNDASDGRSLALSYQTYRFFQTLGIADQMESVTPIWHIKVTDHETTPEINFHARDVGGHPMGFMADIQALRRALSSALEETSVTWRTSVSPQTLSERPYGWQIASDQEVLGEASLVVGADGRHSWVRRWAGVKTWEVDYHQTALVFHIAHTEPHEGWAFEHFLPSGPFAVLPSEGQRSSVVWTEKTPYAASLVALDDDAFNQELNVRFAHLGTVRVCSKRWSYPLHMVWSRQVVGRRWVLLGDAAHTLHPIAGQGFNLGMQDVQTFVDKVRTHHDRGLDIGGDLLLKAYQRTRYPRGLLMAGATHGVNRLFSHPSRWLHRTRRGGFHLLGLCPRLQQSLMRYAMGLA